MKSLEEMGAVVLECESSGQRVVDFCCESGIKVGQYYRWRKKVKFSDGNKRLEFRKVSVIDLGASSRSQVVIDLSFKSFKLHVPLSALNLVIAELEKL